MSYLPSLRGNVSTIETTEVRSTDSSFTSWWTVNDILVFITWVIFAVVLLASFSAFLLQPASNRSKKSSENQSDDTRSFAKSPLTDDKFDNKKYRQKKKPRKGTPSASAFNDEALSSYQGSDYVGSEANSETSSLLEAGLGEKMPDSGEEAVDSKPDRTLSHTLRSVLSHGMVMLMYTETGQRKIKLYLVDSELRWRAVKVLTRKTHKLDLNRVMNVEWGKKTSNFRTTHGASAPDDTCFSLIADTQTLDLKCVSKVERDAVAQGFYLLLEDLRTQNPQNTV